MPTLPDNMITLGKNSLFAGFIDVIKGMITLMITLDWNRLVSTGLDVSCWKEMIIKMII